MIGNATTITNGTRKNLSRRQPRRHQKGAKGNLSISKKRKSLNMIGLLTSLRMPFGARMHLNMTGLVDALISLSSQTSTGAATSL